MKRLLITSVVCCSIATSCFASHRVANSPYVQSLPNSGRFYARCIPADKAGNKGTTTILRVAAENDEIVDTYHWYSPEGVMLGWSPLTGKVAVMSLREGYDSKDEQVEFSFHLGGQQLRSYTAKELKDLGVQSVYTSGGWRLRYKVLGVEQRPPGASLGAGKSVFAVEINNQRKLYFDIETGELRG